LPVDDAPFIIEGSQGVLLDETYGFAPYHTWLDCTFGKADQLLVGTRWSADVTRLVVARTFLTRHGRGPLPTEDDALRPALVDDHNTTGPWQGALRVGHFDAVLARYALDVLAATGSAPTALALTHIDKVQPPWAMCLRYGQHSRLSPAASLTKFLMQVGQAGLKPHYARYESAGAFLNALEATLGLPLGIVSTGPEARSTAFPGLQ
jgi:adenylosuccinate synthase